MTSLPKIAVFCLFGLSSCTVEDKIGTRPQVSDFLSATGADTTSRISRLPFDYSWRASGIDPSRYQNIVVRPVTTRWLRKNQWSNSISEFVPDQKDYLKRCDQLARNWSKSLKKSFSSPVCSYYITTSTSRPGTLILEVALMEVDFGRPPTGIGSMSFEARVKDARTGKYIAIAADRRATISKIAYLNKTTFMDSNEEIFNQWSQQLMEATNADLFPTVKSSWLSPL